MNTSLVSVIALHHQWEFWAALYVFGAVATLLAIPEEIDWLDIRAAALLWWAFWIVTAIDLTKLLIFRRY